MTPWMLVGILLAIPMSVSADELCTTNILNTCSSTAGSGTLTGPGAACVDNTLARWDGATTTVLQCSAVTLSDAGAMSGLTGVTTTTLTASTSSCAVGAVDAANSLCFTSAGFTSEGATADAFEFIMAYGDHTGDQTFTWLAGTSTLGATVAAPAQVAASTVGNALTFTASPATAGASVAGAAAGGAVTITSGAAARFTSGNANGGNISLTTGAGIGTGTAGQVVLPTAGTTAVPQLIGTDNDSGINMGTARVDAIGNGALLAQFQGGGLPTIITNELDVGATTAGATHTVQVTGSGTGKVCYEGATVDTFEACIAASVDPTADNDLVFTTNAVGATLGNIGDLQMVRTITAGGTTGNQTINKPSGTVNLAAAASAVTVTDSVVTANSICMAIARTNDATCAVKNVVSGAGTFTINMTAACTAETSVGFVCFN